MLQKQDTRTSDAVKESDEIYMKNYRSMIFTREGKIISEMTTWENQTKRDNNLWNQNTTERG